MLTKIFRKIRRRVLGRRRPESHITTTQQPKDISTSKQQHQQRQTQQQQQTSLPLLYALARSWAWEAVKFRCATHPEEVSEQFVDYLGETILHWSCLGKPPVECVDAILKQCPDMAKVRNIAGHLPLHVAISYRCSADVLLALIEVYPQGIQMPNGVGSYPIHLLCDYGSSVDSLRVLLETQQGASTITKQDRATGLTPLYILNARKNGPQWRRSLASMREARKRQQAIRNEMKYSATVQSTTTSSQSSSEGGDSSSSGRIVEETNSRPTVIYVGENVTAQKLDDEAALLQRQERQAELMIQSFNQNVFWQKAALLMLVEYTQKPLSVEGLQTTNNSTTSTSSTTDEDDEEESSGSSIVHACAGIPHCPVSLLEFAMLLHREDLLHKKDQNGRIPLHVAAATHAKGLMSRRAQNAIKQVRSEEALQSLLNACPKAAFVSDNDGRLPFALAVHVLRQQWQPHGVAWSKGLQLLLAVNPLALETLNLDERLFPLIWAKRLGSTVDELYRSVRQNPNLFQAQRRSANSSGDSCILEV